MILFPSKLGISLTPFHGHPLESMHHHPSEEEEDLFMGGGGGSGAKNGAVTGEDSSWNHGNQNRASRSASQRLVTSGLALKSRGRLGPFL